MDIGSQASKNTKADGSWIPGTPCMPMPPKPHVIHTDRQGNPNLTNWYAPECFPPGLIPTSSARIVGKFVSNNCNYATAAKAQDSVPSNNIPPCRNFPADNAAFWNKIPFASLLALADAASEKAMGSNPLWNKDCPFPANPQININYMPVTQRRIADAFSSSISSQFAPLTPEKSIRTESRWIKDMQYSCVEATNEERNEQKNGTTGARVADKVLEIGKEIQKQVTTSLLEAASSMPKEDQGIDNAGNHATELNKTPQQKPRRKKHRPKVITEGKPRTRKMTIPKTDSSKENPTAKRNYVQKNALNITTQAPTAQASEESMNHKMNELADSKGMSTGKRKNDRKKILLNKASIISHDEATVEPTDPTRTVAFEGTPTGEPMSWQRKALKKALIASLPKENEENQGGQKQIERRNSVNKTAGSMDQKIAEAARKTCRRALNLDMEGQPKHGSSRCELRENQGSEPRASLGTEEDESSSIIHLGIGVEVIVRNSNNGFGFDFTNSVNKMQKDYMSLPRRGAPSASVLAKTTTGHRENWEVNYQNHTRANYQKTAPILQKNTSVLESPLGTHSSQVSADGSNCSTVTDLTGEAQAKPLKRKNSLSFPQADSHSTNSGGIHYNKLLAYQNLVQFPQSYKKKRTEKATGTSFSGAMKDIRLELAPQKNFEASTSTFNCQISALYCDTDGLLNATRDSETTFQPNLSSRSQRSTKRSRSCRGLDFASPSKTVSQSYPTEGILVDCHIQQLDNFRPNTSIEVLVAQMHATMTKKKRTKKRVSVVPMATSTASEEKPQGTLMLFNQNQFSANSLGAHPELMWKQMFSVDEIANQLNCLDINRESSERDIKELSALIPYNIRHLNQQELVLYKRDGTIVPFEHIKKRRPRSKVELDEETNKVWKLLMESINSEGIDGTDEEKARWWKEEREVFRGRANSFIARMHLVQGDRRFSQWKGSVVDSVIGVFLTQNVADHLSSSAFMSLAARFPLKSNQPSYEEITSTEIDKPINCMHDPDSNTNWSRQMPSESSCETFSVALHDTVFDEEREVADSDDSLGSSTGSLSSRTGLDTCHELMVNGSTTTTERGEHDFVKEHRREIIDVLLSPNSLDSSISQKTKIKESNSEISSATDGFKINFQNNCSFVELLQKASSTMHNGIYSQGNGILRTDNFEITDINNLPISAEEAQNYPTPNVVLGDENSSNQSQRKLLQDAKTNDIPSAQSHKAGLQPGFAGALDIEESSIAADKLDNSPPKSAGSCLIGQHPLESKELKINDAKRKAKSRRVGNKIQDNIDWDALRKQAEANSMNRERSASTMDSLDWEAVRSADVDEIANTIKERGMNNVLAKRIKDFLNQLVQEHGSIDLEWLRDVPPDKAKEYLLSIRGLGLKSVECVRLLTLHHLAFPVDTNVGRIAVRLGWVPLQPLPESLQLHLLELYPVLESIQKYLWPRLCKLNQRTLYELHYQMITFGKVFCTKSKPNCNACPMRGECRHFASAFASARLALPGLEQTGMVSAAENRSANQNPAAPIERLPLPLPHASECPEGNAMPQANWKARARVIDCIPIVEEPASPEPEGGQILENDIEDSFYEDPDEIPTIKLNIEEFNQNLQNYIQQNMELQESDMSKALVALTAESASIPMPKLKNVSRLRTEHQVYELPDSHPLVQGLDRREPDDPCSYLLAIWTPGEMADSIAPPELRCSSQESGKLCDEKTCFSCNSVREANSHIVRGTLLIPCRTAMRGSFPLNGTYFQVNEVFADHDSSLNPIHVPREWIWNLPRRTVYFGTSIPTIFKGLTTEGIQHCFWRGYVCVRGFDQTTRAPRPLMARLHFPASKLTRGRNGENK